MKLTIPREKIISFLKWSEKYIQTDMTYLAKGSFWLLLGKVGLFLISFLTIIAFGYWLPKEVYGTYQFILAGLGLLAIFTLPGIDTGLIKSIAQGKEGTLKLAVKEKMKWGLVGSLFSLGLAIWYFLKGNDILTISFLLGVFFIPFRTTFSIFAAFWNGRKRFDLQTKYQVISAGSSALLVIPTIYLTNNVSIIIAVFLASRSFFGWFFYQKTKKQTINDEQDLKAISFGKNLTLITVIRTIAAHLDKIIIWKFLGAASVAIYTFALLPIEKFQEAPPIRVLALPKLGQNKIDEQRKKGIISKFLRLFIFTVPAALVLIFIAPFLYQVFFPQYLESVIYFQALSFLIALLPFTLLGAALLAEMKKEALCTIKIAVPLLKIILFFILLPYFGIWGIVAAVLISEILGKLLTFYFFLKI